MQTLEQKATHNLTLLVMAEIKRLNELNVSISAYSDHISYDDVLDIGKTGVGLYNLMGHSEQGDTTPLQIVSQFLTIPTLEEVTDDLLGSLEKLSYDTVHGAAHFTLKKMRSLLTDELWASHVDSLVEVYEE